MYEEKKTVLRNGYVEKYIREEKKKRGCIQQVEYNFQDVQEENADKAFSVMKKMWDISDEKWNKIGFKVKHINGTTSIPFNIEMATDEERDFLDLGFITLEDLEKQYGTGKGGFVNKIMATGLSKGFTNGATETELTLTDIQESVLAEDEIDDMFN